MTDHTNSQDGQPSSLDDVLDEILKASDSGEITVDDIMRIVADRSLGMTLAVLGLIAAMPVVGGLPGVSLAVAVLCLLAIGRALVGGRSWSLPFDWGKQGLEREKLETGVAKMRPGARRVDRLLRKRLTSLTDDVVQRRIIAVAAGVLALVMLPLSVIPGGVVPAALGIVLFGLALLARDGLMALLGYLMILLTAGMAIWVL